MRSEGGPPPSPKPRLQELFDELDQRRPWMLFHSNEGLVLIAPLGVNLVVTSIGIDCSTMLNGISIVARMASVPAIRCPNLVHIRLVKAKAILSGSLAESLNF